MTVLIRKRVQEALEARGDSGEKNEGSESELMVPNRKWKKAYSALVDGQPGNPKRAKIQPKRFATVYNTGKHWRLIFPTPKDKAYALKVLKQAGVKVEAAADDIDRLRATYEYTVFYRRASGRREIDVKTFGPGKDAYKQAEAFRDKFLTGKAKDRMAKPKDSVSIRKTAGEGTSGGMPEVVVTVGEWRRKKKLKPESIMPTSRRRGVAAVLARAPAALVEFEGPALGRVPPSPLPDFKRIVKKHGGTIKGKNVEFPDDDSGKAASKEYNLLVRKKKPDHTMGDYLMAGDPAHHRKVYGNERQMSPLGELIEARMPEVVESLSDVLDDLVQAAGEYMDAPNADDMKADKKVQKEADRFEKDLSKALDDWAKKNGDKLADEDADGDTLLDDEGAYLVFMTLRGEGVGIWDGSWDDHFVNPKDIKELGKFLGKKLGKYADSTGGGSLNQAIDDAAHDQAEEEDDDYERLREDKGEALEEAEANYAGGQMVRLDNGQMVQVANTDLTQGLTVGTTVKGSMKDGKFEIATDADDGQGSDRYGMTAVEARGDGTYDIVVWRGDNKVDELNAETPEDAGKLAADGFKKGNQVHVGHAQKHGLVVVRKRTDADTIAGWVRKKFESRRPRGRVRQVTALGGDLPKKGESQDSYSAERARLGAFRRARGDAPFSPMTKAPVPSVQRALQETLGQKRPKRRRRRERREDRGPQGETSLRILSYLKERGRAAEAQAAGDYEGDYGPGGDADDPSSSDLGRVNSMLAGEGFAEISAEQLELVRALAGDHEDVDKVFDATGVDRKAINLILSVSQGDPALMNR